MKKLSALATFAVLLAAPVLAQVASQPVSIVAAENFYGDIAKQIGGPDVKVTSILSNPDQDPHLFEVSPSVGRDVSAARIVIYNGIDYDPWMEKLLGAARSTKRETIVVADLVGKKTGDNPHIWYDPATMVALAKTLSEALIADDPGHKAGYEQRLARFEELSKTHPGEGRRTPSKIGRHARHGDGAYLRLHVRSARSRGQESVLSACGDEQHRTQCLGCSCLRERPQGTPGQVVDLQQPGHGPSRRSDGEDRQSVERPRRRGDRDRACR